MLNALLFVMVKDELSGDFRAGLPLELLFIADGVQDAKAKFNR